MPRSSVKGWTGSPDASWGPKGSKMGKDPKAKRLPRTWGKRKTSSAVKAYQKVMR